VLEGDSVADGSLDPASFDIVREEFKDTRDRIDNDPDRELERSRREGERRDTRPEPFIRIRGERVPNPEFIRQYPDAAVNTFGFTLPQMEALVNDDSVVLTPEMVEVINVPEMRITRDGEITRRTGRDVIRRSRQFDRANILPRFETKSAARKKRSRKPSKYQKELGKQLKMLKKKHPRTKITNLMKRAHRATKKKLK